GQRIGRPDAVYQRAKGDRARVAGEVVGEDGWHQPRQRLAQAPDDGIGRHKRLGASAVAAQAQPAAGLDREMPDADAVAEVVGLERTAGHDHAAADAGPEREPDHVVDTAGGPEPPLGEGRRRAVVQAPDRQAELRLELRPKWEAFDPEHLARQITGTEPALDDPRQGDAETERPAAPRLQMAADARPKALEHGPERFARGVLDGRSLDRAVEPHEAGLEPRPTDIDTDQVV